VNWDDLSVDTREHILSRTGLCGCRKVQGDRWEVCAYHRGFERAVQMREARNDGA